MNNEIRAKKLVIEIQQSSNQNTKQQNIQTILDILKQFRFSLAKRYKNKGVELEDIIQQVDLKMIEAIYDYNEHKDSSVIRHLICRTRNGIWNFYRKEMNYFDENRKKVDFDEQEENYAIIQGEDKLLIQNIVLSNGLKKLNLFQREVIRKYFFEDKTQSMIAKEFNITQGNVSRAKQRALKELKKYMEDDDIQL
ncbi:sigma-70 family RNA polymerase sigma factor [Chengkuizengella axinellae]|uniref:Sigma-70 family RNA polymerase sigma factor n=1 Tax=Chengkuizengella axinellae TaxID=3064388 RepID=A0ABT9IWB9_9BACL|nr:sigma-70 family RNA polymerase sigma factor [Chengkuizengella sp. 2205SS18-9]MDP5273655.1 sigma-70 family RNA polymerase sigma factor [Chengkuizengella sp. 2205SS18-9]